MPKIAFEPQPVGKFVVMRHSTGVKRMHCTMVHDTYASAQSEAQRLAAEMIEQYGPGSVGLYVLQIQGRVGVFDGVLEDGRKMV